MTTEVIFTINNSTKPNDIISKLDYSNCAKSIILNYKCGEFIHGELLTIINSYMNLLKSQGIEYEFNLYNDEYCESINYASRINFFKNINYDFKEKFKRHDTSKSLMEITEFNSENMFHIITKMSYILRHSFNLDKDIIDGLNYCLGELVANVYSHSNSKSNGLIYIQKFNKNNRLKICIVDNGDGFYKSFDKNEEFYILSEEELLINSINEGFKSFKGNGKGYGLFHTKEFVAKTEGVLNINTCGKILTFDKRGARVCNTKYWQGSIVSLSIKTNVNIKFNEVFTSKNDYYTPCSLEDQTEHLENEIIESWILK